MSSKEVKMANPQIVEYIKNTVSGGFSLEDVKAKLLESGMSQQDIDDAVKEAGVGESKPAESQPTEQPAEQPQEQPAQTEQQAPAEGQAIQPAKEEGTFKWWARCL